VSVAARIVMMEHQYASIRSHLIPLRPKAEEAAFVYARFERGTFEFVEWYPVPASDFVHRSLYHIELTDGCRAKTIKRAHDLKCSIIEFHSHPHARVVRFSPSDCLGFREYVPHVSWRLKGRPYGAVVVSPRGFDSLVWIANPNLPDGAAELVLEGRVLHPSGLSFEKGDYANAIREI